MIETNEVWFCNISPPLIDLTDIAIIEVCTLRISEKVKLETYRADGVDGPQEMEIN